MGFTGIVSEMGILLNVKTEADVLLWDGSKGRSHEITVQCSPKIITSKTYIGESICVEGVCLTVTEFGHGDTKNNTKPFFKANVAGHTLDITTFKTLKTGDSVNLELAALLQDSARNSGHEVQGHVDGTAEIIKKVLDRDNVRYTFALPKAVRGLVVHKGYVAIGGASLTVCNTTDNSFEVMLVPHTQTAITLGKLQVGDFVNVEAHCIAKHLKPMVEVNLEQMKQDMRKEMRHIRKEMLLVSALAGSLTAFGVTAWIMKMGRSNL